MYEGSDDYDSGMEADLISDDGYDFEEPEDASPVPLARKVRHVISRILPSVAHSQHHTSSPRGYQIQVHNVQH